MSAAPNCMERLPLQPLVVAAGIAQARGKSTGRYEFDRQPSMDERGILGLAEMIGVPARTIHRWKANGGVPWTQADRAACAIGLHPSNIWPDWFPAQEPCRDS